MVYAHSGMKEMVLLPSSQLDPGVSVLPEEFLQLGIAVIPSPEDALVSGVKCLTLQLLLVLRCCRTVSFSAGHQHLQSAGEQNSIKSGLSVEEVFHASAQRYLQSTEK